MLDLKKLVNWLSGTSAKKEEVSAVAAERRRFQRLQLEDCEATFFGGGPFPVSNLSYGGFQVDLASWAALPGIEKNTVYDCQLKMQGVQLACRIVVKNLLNTLAGCAFSDMTPAQSGVVADFIRPRIVGCSLREINAAKLKNDSPELKMRWFQGENGAQVFLWQTVEGESVKQEFYFFDYFMTWDKAGEGLRTGKVKSESRGSFGRISPDSVMFFRIPPYRALKLGRTVLECSKLPEEARERILQEIASEEKRLFHRYIVKDGGVVFVTDEPAGHKLSVLNISVKGIALYNAPESPVNCDNALSGSLVIGNSSIRATFKPAYTHANLVGGRLLVVDADSQQQFEEFLAPRLLAQYLEEMPSPTERPPFAPPNAHSYLYTGLYNTHLLSLVESGDKLNAGRIAFMDRALSFRNNKLSEFRCPEGLIFPGDWELDAAILWPLDAVEPMTRKICREMVDSAEQIAPEVKRAWLAVLVA